MFSFILAAQPLFSGLLIVNGETAPNNDYAPNRSYTEVASYSSTYYNTVNGLTGDPLLEGLATLSKNKHRYYNTYEEVWGAASISDANPKNSKNEIIDFYTGVPISNAHNAQVWNREHVWSKSLSGNLYKTTEDKDRGAGADIHHIRPSIDNINSSRGNRRYGNTDESNPKYYSFANDKISTSSSDTLWGYTSSEAFEPLNRVKGDIARIIMYMYMHYSTEVGANASHSYAGNLVITNIIYTSSDTADQETREQAAWDLLIEWNELDGVDEFEMSRNNYCASITGLRNPFVDHPEYAKKIWDPTYSKDSDNTNPGDGSGGSSTPTTPNTTPPQPAEDVMPVIPTEPVVTLKPVHKMYEYEFTQQTFFDNKATALGDRNWTANLSLSQYSVYGYESGKGQSFGLDPNYDYSENTDGFSGAKITVTTPFNEITSIYIYTCGGDAEYGRVEFYVGSDKPYVASKKLTDSIEEYRYYPSQDFPDGLSGRVSFHFIQTSVEENQKNFYISKIKIGYTEYVEEKHYCNFKKTDGTYNFESADNGHWIVCVDCGRGTEIKPHSFAYVSQGPATCTEDEYLFGQCICGATHMKAGIPALGHDIAIDEAIPATCTNPGLTQGQHCARCNDESQRVEQTEIAPTGHKYSKTTIAPTCTEQGYAAHICSKCNHEYHDTYKDPLGHRYGTKTTKPTCTEQGYTTLTCSRCSHAYKTNYTAATGHNYVGTVTKAKCETQGYTTYKCSKCKDTYVSNYVSALGHSTVPIEGKAATCKSTGLTTGSKCTVCRKVVTSQKTIPMLPHTEETISGKNATCTADGLTNGTKCSVCKVILEEQQVIPALGHTLVTTKGTPATCTKDGKTDGVKCSSCTYVESTQQTIPAIGHLTVIDPRVEPDCVNTGLKEGSHCSHCNEVFTAQEVIPALGHNYKQEVHDATCEERGYTLFSCLDCTYTYKDNYSNALNHDIIIDAGYAKTCTTDGLTDGEHCSRCTYKIDQIVIPASHAEEITVPGTPATCTTPGVTSGAICSICGEELSDAGNIIPALGHKPVIDQAVAATCLKSGLSVGSHCSECNEVLLSQTIVPALGHKEEVLQGVNPTCTNTGLTQGTHCSTCKEVLTPQEVIPALNHDIIIDQAVNATCLTDGLTEGEHCSRCDYIINQQIVYALGHSEVIDQAIDPTCTSTGLTQGSHCENCTHVFTIQTIVPALGHTEVVSPYVEPTCENDGLTQGTHCSTCLTALMEQEVIPALGHKYDTEVVDVKCMEDGYTIYTCSVCSHTYEDNFVYSVGHFLIDVNGSNPTCTETGLTAGSYCEECKEFVVPQEIIPALGHTEVVVGTPTLPTCTTAGVAADVTCSVCNEVLYHAGDNIPALGHDIVIDYAVEPTCTETGLTEGEHCTRCEYKVAQETIASSGHEYETYSVPASCTQNGYTLHVCSVCEYTYEDNIIDASTHIPNLVFIKGAASTCEES